ncbi:MAG: cadherin-like domain-containing protein, partial [Proteobacteria bacterium]|nr:cadherin-like domain-containing protein [Pseudomonadota bacterium]
MKSTHIRSSVALVALLATIGLAAPVWALPPVATPPVSSSSLAEDFGVATGDLGSVFVDPDGDPMTFSQISPVPSLVTNTTVDSASGTVTFNSIANIHGVETFVWQASDINSETATYTFTLTVSPLNDPPTIIGLLPTIVTPEDASTSTDLSGIFDDVDIVTDGDSLTLTIESFSGSVIDTAEMSGTDLNISFLLDQNGTATVTVRATDSDGLFVESTANVTVNPVNDPPTVLSAASDVTVDEDTSANISFVGVFDDVDILTNGDSLTLTVVKITGGIVDTATMSGNDLNITLLPDQNGKSKVTVRATDSGGLFVESEVEV